MINIENLDLLYFSNDLPCPYKLKCGYTINIYPIKVKDWLVFKPTIDMLQIDKNEINDIEIIKMSNLEYFIKLVLQGDKKIKQMYGERLGNLFFYSMNENNVRIAIENNKYILVIVDDKENIKATINQKEFDDITKIILFQNIKDYDDRNFSKEVKEEINSYYSMKYRDIKSPSLEQKKTFVISKTGILIKDINDMSYRIFEQVYNNCLESELYIGNKIIQGSYKYKTDDVKHYIFEKKKDILDEVFNTSDEQMVNKINKINVI